MYSKFQHGIGNGDSFKGKLRGNQKLNETKQTKEVIDEEEKDELMNDPPADAAKNTDSQER